MQSLGATFFRLVSLKIAPGVSFLGTVEIEVNMLDATGWVVRSVMTSERGANREVTPDWAKLVRIAIDKDTAFCDTVTEQCRRWIWPDRSADAIWDAPTDWELQEIKRIAGIWIKAGCYEVKPVYSWWDRKIMLAEMVAL